jgi:hypothetical protein
MLKSKLPDDANDIPVVAPDAIRVAPEDEAPSDPIRDLMHGASLEPPIHAESDFSAAEVPPVDTTFRPTAVNDIGALRRKSFGRRALRAVTAFLLTACIGGAAFAWNSHGHAVQQLIAEWAPLFAKASSPMAKAAPPAQPALAAAQMDASNASAPAPQAATEAVAPSATTSPDQPSLESMARDLANAGQEIEALKASIEQLKAGQQQLVAMVSEKAPVSAARTRKPVQQPAPLRPVAALAPAPTHKPPPLAPPPPRQAISAPSLPPGPATRQIEPLPPTPGATLADPELPSVPRPPMPLR